MVANTTNRCKNKLDRFCETQEIVCDFQSQFHGTGSRSDMCN